MSICLFASRTLQGVNSLVNPCNILNAVSADRIKTAAVFSVILKKLLSCDPVSLATAKNSLYE